MRLVIDKDDEEEIHFVNASFDVDIRSKITDDWDIHNNKFKKEIYYMNSGAKCYMNLVMLHDLPRYTVKVLEFIRVNLRYGTNVIELLNPIIVASDKEHKLTSNEVSKALKQLRELGIIRKLNEVDMWKNDLTIRPKMYVVNHNYIFNGNIKKLKIDLEKQQ